MQNQQPSTLKEIRVHGTQDFPCAFYQTGTRIKGNMVKHHWHEEVELLYFSGGEFCLEVNMERFNISEECFYFINPGELHSIFYTHPDNLRIVCARWNTRSVLSYRQYSCSHILQDVLPP